MNKIRDILIIGAGIKGLAVAFQILRKNPAARVTVVDKEPAGIHHMSDGSHNTQVGHSGLYYTTGTLKAILNESGFALLREYIHSKNLPIKQCGKYVVGYHSDRDNALLDTYYRNALGNGCSPQKVRLIGGDALREKEPLLSKKITAALEVDETYVFDANAILKALEKDVIDSGGQVRHNTAVIGFTANPKERFWTIKTDQGNLKADFIVNESGGQADRIARKLGGAKNWFIIPIVGEYKEVKNTTEMHLQRLIYQVPADQELPFLDPHAIESDGVIHFGPTAMVKWGMREHYEGSILPHIGDMLTAHVNPGTWAFYMKNLKDLPRESGRHFSNRIFTKACQRMIDAEKLKIDPSNMKFYKRGIRGQYVSSNGVMSNEFGLEKHGIGGELKGITDTNPGSPGFTSALAIGLLMADITVFPEKYIGFDFNARGFREIVKRLLSKQRVRTGEAAI